MINKKKTFLYAPTNCIASLMIPKEWSYIESFYLDVYDVYGTINNFRNMYVCDGINIYLCHCI